MSDIAQHTPGPWFIGTVWPGKDPSKDVQVEILAKLKLQPRMVVDVESDDRNKDPIATAKADAALIAAAPELLAACEAALEAYGPGETSSPLQAQLHAAITKARGTP